MVPLAAFALTGVLFLAAMLGVPLVSLAAGALAGLWLAPGALPWAVAALAASLLAEFTAVLIAPKRDPALALGGALVALGRILGAEAGAGAWFALAHSSLQPAAALRGLAAKGVRALGVLLALAIFAAGS